MIKINVSSKTIENFKTQVLSNFYDKKGNEKVFEKNEQNKKWKTTFIDDNEDSTKLTETQKDYFYTLYQRLNKPQYIDDLDITVCPYCNRNYIFNFKKTKSLNTIAQLDHFFDKSTYPYFSVSIFNLVPSCQTCNQIKSQHIKICSN